MTEKEKVKSIMEEIFNIENIDYYEIQPYEDYYIEIWWSKNKDKKFICYESGDMKFLIDSHCYAPSNIAELIECFNKIEHFLNNERPLKVAVKKHYNVYRRFRRKVKREVEVAYFINRDNNIHCWTLPIYHDRNGTILTPYYPVCHAMSNE